MKQFHVYEDWTLEETPRCFYVGKGDDDRVARLKRGKYHSEIVVKHGQRRIVVFSSNNEHEVFDHERQLIKERHVHPKDPEYNGIGCNRTLGGQGNSGRIVSEETCRKISEAKKGKHPNKIWSDEERKATSERMSKLHKGKVISESQKQVLRDVMNEPERKQKMVATVTQKIRDKYANDPEFVQRIRETRKKGESHPSAILSEDNVRDIRYAWNNYNASVRGATKKFCVEHAQRFGLTPENVFGIIKYKSWKHLA